MKRRDFLAVAVTALALAGCWRTTYGWNQKLTVTVQTPEGEKSGSAVTHISWSIGRLPLSATIREASIQGEATVVEVAPGRHLFALIKSPKHAIEYWAENVWVTEDIQSGESEQAYLGRILTHVMQARNKLSLPKEFYPTLVTFGDINDPASVKEVKPGDLSSTFGPGYALKSITLEITDETVTDGQVQELLPWIGDPTIMENPHWKTLPVFSRELASRLLKDYRLAQTRFKKRQSK